MNIAKDKIVSIDYTLTGDQGQVLEQQWTGGRVLYSPTQRRLGLFQMRPEYQQPKALADPRARVLPPRGLDRCREGVRQGARPDRDPAGNPARVTTVGSGRRP